MKQEFPKTIREFKYICLKDKWHSWSDSAIKEALKELLERKDNVGLFIGKYRIKEK